jgi:hypothetical protein
MKTKLEVHMRAIAAGLLLVGIMGIVGCQGDQTSPPPDTLASPPPPVNQDLYNLSQLNNFPAEVRAAFSRDFPHSGVSSASVTGAETGPALYRIVYIQNGQPHEVMYDRLGKIVTAPPQPQNPNLTRPGFPAPQPQQAPPPPAPTNQMQPARGAQ